jgi:hypothetical protein
VCLVAFFKISAAYETCRLFVSLRKNSSVFIKSLAKPDLGTLEQARNAVEWWQLMCLR